MGEHEHHRSRWKFRVWKDVACPGDRSESKSTMGCDFIDGMGGISDISRIGTKLHGQDSFYKPLTPEQSRKAFQNEFDFDAPAAIDFDVLVEKLRDIKAGYRILHFQIEYSSSWLIENALKSQSIPSGNTPEKRKQV